MYYRHSVRAVCCCQQQTAAVNKKRILTYPDTSWRILTYDRHSLRALCCCQQQTHRRPRNEDLLPQKGLGYRHWGADAGCSRRSPCPPALNVYLLPAYRLPALTQAGARAGYSVLAHIPYLFWRARSGKLSGDRDTMTWMLLREWGRRSIIFKWKCTIVLLLWKKWNK